MKIFLFLIILPLASFGQTIHVKDKKIVYEGREDLGHPMHTVSPALLRGIAGITLEYPASLQAGDSVNHTGKMRLESPRHLVRYVNYNFKLILFSTGYKYVIDDVYYTEQERGGKTDTLSSEKMLEKMGDTGDIVGDTEKILNETDMRFQKLLAVLRKEMKKT